MNLKISVVIPAFKVKGQILDVIAKIGPEVDSIILIDDFCPEQVGDFVKQNCKDQRVKILHNTTNLGVGGAVIKGYLYSLSIGADIVVKIDGDGQMNPALINRIVNPIVSGKADYVKGNRFYNLDDLRDMPKVRLFGNAALSFLTKLSSGYWDIFDPTNGYTAIHAKVLRLLPLKKISNRYFFESDMLFRLNILRAVVVDMPMVAVYGEEKSNLRISKVACEFLLKNIRNLSKRVFYNYYLRDMNPASFELPIGLFLLIFGSGFGIWHWITSYINGIPAATGTIMLSALSILMGVQFLLAFLSFDISAVPQKPIHTNEY